MERGPAEDVLAVLREVLPQPRIDISLLLHACLLDVDRISWIGSTQIKVVRSLLSSSATSHNGGIAHTGIMMAGSVSEMLFMTPLVCHGSRRPLEKIRCDVDLRASKPPQ